MASYRRPKWTPQTPEARRLEHIRKNADLSLSAFHERLLEAVDDYEVSYAAVRIWHYGRDQNGEERTPPLDYLKHVAEVYGYRLAWLTAGDREPTDAEMQTKELAEQTKAGARRLSMFEQADKVIAEEFPAFTELGNLDRIGIQSLWLDLWAEAEAVNRRGPEDATFEPNGRAWAETIGFHLQAPAHVLLGEDGYHWITDSPQLLHAYVAAMTQALSVLLAARRVPVTFGEALQRRIDQGADPFAGLEDDDGDD